VKIASLYFAPHVSEYDIMLVNRTVYPCNNDIPAYGAPAVENTNNVMDAEHLAGSDNIAFPLPVGVRREVVTWEYFLDKLAESCESNL